MPIKTNASNEIRELTSDELGHVSGAGPFTWARKLGGFVGFGLAATNLMVVGAVITAGVVSGVVSAAKDAASTVYDAIKFW